VRDLRRTAFSSRCRPIAGSPRRRLVDRELSPKPVCFDRLGRVPAREQIVHCLIPTGERKPRVGHREMKFATMKFACFLSRQQTWGAPPKLGEAHKAFLARIGFSRRPTFLSRMSASSKVRG
jgi:hypothetical protein